MGGQLTKPLEEYTASELGDVVEEHLGAIYVGYAASIRENGVDGALIAEMNEKEFVETLHDLKITSRLHCRVLTKEWKTANRKNSSQGEISAQLEAAAEYDVSKETPESELTPFDEIAETVFSSCSDPLYAGVHLLDSNGDHLSLADRLIASGSGDDSGSCTTTRGRVHLPAGKSRCVALLLDKDAPDFVSESLPDRYKQLVRDFLPTDGELCYIGHVIRARSGHKIGMVCALTKKQEDESEKHELLSILAQKTQEQLEMRKALLQRNRLLRRQMNPHSDIGVSSIDPVELSDLTSSRPHIFPSPEEIAESGIPRRSAMLPMVQANMATRDDELDHLPEGYFEEMKVLGIKDRLPVPKHDRERTAAVEALGLKNLDPASQTAKALRSLVELAASLFDMPLGEITFQTHDTHFGLARYIEASPEVEERWANFHETINCFPESEAPFLCKTSRNKTLCSYVSVLEKTFVVHDIYKDTSFEWVEKIGGPRFYCGSPIMVNGRMVASLCVLDFRERPDFTKAHEIQLEQIAASVGREIENWSLRREMEQLEGYRRLIASHTDNKFSPPTGDVAIIFTDIQGSTALWEADASAMQAALALHDDIMRKCCAASHGYEIRTEGDAFHLAFHDSLDAISFALKTQAELHNAPWSNDILSLPDAAEKDGFRGLRVRMAIHYGPAHQHTNEVSRRQEYHGETVYIAKSIEAMTQGGQILVTHDAWCGASYLADTKLGSPQVIDLGEHVLLTGKTKKDGFIAKQIFQLLPSSLAFDYFGQHRATEEESEHSHRPSERGTLTGRRFPPIKSERRLSTSFHDAPCASSTVTMVFVHTYDLEQAYDDPAIVLAALAKLIGTLLMEQGQGYQCKNTMIAFKCQSSAVRFGLALIDALTRRRIDGKDLSRLIKVGIFEGKFTSMGPHQTTGRADYYGPVVNRAARVAGAAEPGQVCLGVVTADRPELMADLETEFIGEKQLKGLQEAVSLYSCRKV